MNRADKVLWQRLRAAAEVEADRLLKALPAPIREQVERLPIVFETVPSAALVRDGIEPDLLGLFVGDALDESGVDPIPSEILLFLLNIWEEAGHDDAKFRREVRRTLLHEIGHYLGLEEEGLIERDLE